MHTPSQTACTRAAASCSTQHCLASRYSHFRRRESAHISITRTCTSDSPSKRGPTSAAGVPFLLLFRSLSDRRTHAAYLASHIVSSQQGQQSAAVQPTLPEALQQCTAMSNAPPPTLPAHLHLSTLPVTHSCTRTTRSNALARSHPAGQARPASHTHRRCMSTHIPARSHSCLPASSMQGTTRHDWPCGSPCACGAATCFHPSSTLALYSAAQPAAACPLSLLPSQSHAITDPGSLRHGGSSTAGQLRHTSPPTTVPQPHPEA